MANDHILIGDETGDEIECPQCSRALHFRHRICPNCEYSLD